MRLSHASRNRYLCHRSRRDASRIAITLDTSNSRVGWRARYRNKSQRSSRSNRIRALSLFPSRSRSKSKSGLRTQSEYHFGSAYFAETMRAICFASSVMSGGRAGRAPNGDIGVNGIWHSAAQTPRIFLSLTNEIQKRIAYAARILSRECVFRRNDACDMLRRV